MISFIKRNKFLTFGIISLFVITIVDINFTYIALENTMNQFLKMILLVPPIFIIMGLLDTWIPKETIINLMGENSKMKGMFFAFLLGAFSAGPTLIAFPIAHIMLKKGAKYSNVLFFLMVWSSLKLPIIFFQVSSIGYHIPLIINSTLFIVFIISSMLSDYIFAKKDKESFLEKANQNTKD